MKLKISWVISIFLIAGTSIYCSAQTLDEIVNKHLEAHGGADRWSGVDALKITGMFTAFSEEKEYMCYKTSTGSYYGDFYMGEFNILEALHGDIAWIVDPWQEISYAREISADEEYSFQLKAEFFTPFLNYKERGHEAEYLGLDTVDGMQMHELKLTRTNGKVETWYLSAETYLEYMCQSEWVDFARNTPAETYFDDFRTVGGLVIPYFIERTFWQRDRILIIEDVEVNPGVDESMFCMPSRKEMELLGFLEGTWDVKVEAWTRRGTWYDLGTTSSTISFASANLLQENISYNRMLPISKQISFTFDDEDDKYDVSIYNALTTRLSLYEGELTDTSFVFQSVLAACPDTAVSGMTAFQYSINSIDDNGFVMEVRQSSDGGQNWNAFDRFTYVRKNEE